MSGISYDFVTSVHLCFLKYFCFPAETFLGVDMLHQHYHKQTVESHLETIFPSLEKINVVSFLQLDAENLCSFSHKARLLC